MGSALLWSLSWYPVCCPPWRQRHSVNYFIGCLINSLVEVLINTFGDQSLFEITVTVHCLQWMTMKCQFIHCSGRWLFLSLKIVAIFIFLLYWMLCIVGMFVFSTELPIKADSGSLWSWSESCYITLCSAFMTPVHCTCSEVEKKSLLIFPINYQDYEKVWHTNKWQTASGHALSVAALLEKLKFFCTLTAEI